MCRLSRYCTFAVLPISSPELLGQDKPNRVLGVESIRWDRATKISSALSMLRRLALHRCWADGNRGAHPEKYPPDSSALLALAQKSIKDVFGA